MGQDNLISFFETLQSAFLEGRLDELKSRFTLPVVIYSLAGVTVLRNETEIRTILEQYRAAIIAMAAESTKLEIIERDATLNNRLRVTVRTRVLDSQARMVASSLIRYFLIENAESYRIEMMEYLEAPLPPDKVERIVH